MLHKNTARTTNSGRTTLKGGNMKPSSHLVRTSTAVAATAVIGGFGTKVTSRWYRHLDKPAWQPPGTAFGPAWTTLYTLMALASARTLDRLKEPRERRAFATALGANLVLNAGWSWLFFTARRPRLALAEILLLEASTLDLTRRAANADAPAARMLVPYAGWVAFATALNASIAHRNPQGQPPSPTPTQPASQVSEGQP